MRNKRPAHKHNKRSAGSTGKEYRKAEILYPVQEEQFFHEGLKFIKGEKGQYPIVEEQIYG